MTIRTTFNLLLAIALCCGMVEAQADQRQKMGGTDPQVRIVREVRHEILMLPYYTLFDEIGYRVEGNKVVLEGTVTRPSLKSDVENAVKRIEGVESVENKIEVTPPSPADDEIRRAAYRAIYGHPALSRYAWGANPPIHIIVNRGRIKLVGIVDSEMDKNIAGVQAKSVPNAFAVDNQLQVAGQKPS